MKIGYARVSTRDQNLEMQTEALGKAGCEKIFKETKSAVKERQELESMLAHLREGDVVVVWKLDRLGRSLKHLIDLVSGFREKGIEFISLNDSIDTTTAQGRLTFNIFASFAEFEREIIRERTLAGLQAARERGRIGGRKKGLSPDAKKTAFACYQLWVDHSRSVSEILKIVNVSKATFYRYIDWVKKEKEKNM
ncbi:recombinase family protein [Plebeiibacterium sediminum]|uniref:Recombinase family protein n=1 Tax=Plebeiibacterium sediminum TaxID=2992112 RepID=A0AAE3M5S9_9BACT|nr:recombinase family protein [Plebeiobacterium sediminum]MCW3787657.1 recombinase family protein [Plebeiobacterium sediminum]